jgi:hypothetical protein
MDTSNEGEKAVSAFNPFIGLGITAFSLILIVFILFFVVPKIRSKLSKVAVPRFGRRR